ncbi:magnesium transporter [Chytriomyces sp. MP71]|nr:magnesium transporter [Chytriomyces sp. MP71]
MVLAFGVLYALTATTLIGSGQTLQKFAVSRVASDVDANMANALVSLTEKRGKKRNVEGRSRVSNPVWLLGISLCYAGEVFNGLALGHTSAAVVTPLGIFSVIIASVLGTVFLKEDISRNQRIGYAYILVGVILILFVSPQTGNTLGRTPDEILTSLSSTLFLSGFSSIFLVQTVLIYHALFRRTTINLLASICSLFGAIVVVGSKVISSLLQTAASSKTSLYQTNDAVPALFIIVIMVVGSVVIQEFFKQEALTRFSISKFQPIFFAGFNTAAVLSSVVLFREFDTWVGFTGFLVVFSLAIAVILQGSVKIQMQDGGVGDLEPGSVTGAGVLGMGRPK